MDTSLRRTLISAALADGLADGLAVDGLDDEAAFS